MRNTFIFLACLFALILLPFFLIGCLVRILAGAFLKGYEQADYIMLYIWTTLFKKAKDKE